jgi:hypothetical protein
LRRISSHLKKLEDQSKKMVLLGYEAGSKAYKVFDPLTQWVHVTRDVVFDEAASWNWEEAGVESLRGDFDIEYTPASGAGTNATVHAPDAHSATSPAIVRAPAAHSATSPAIERALDVNGSPPPSTPAHAAEPMPQHGAVDFVTPTTANTPTAEDHEVHVHRYRNLANIDDELEQALLLAEGEEHATLAEAQAEAGWHAAMDEEMASIKENGTWELYDLPAGQRPIGLKWVYKLKKDPVGEVIHHKACLVAKGYAQRAGIDFNEVFASVARLNSVCVLLAVAAHHSWEVHHLDVKSAFLNSNLMEEVYVSDTSQTYL